MPKHPDWLQEIEDSSHSELIMKVLGEISRRHRIEDAITKANADYAKGVDMHEIFKELKEVERDNT